MSTSDNARGPVTAITITSRKPVVIMPDPKPLGPAKTHRVIKKGNSNWKSPTDVVTQHET
jgi:hypothetical protein